MKYRIICVGCAAYIGGLALTQKGLRIGYAAVVYGAVFLALGFYERRRARVQVAKQEAGDV